MKCRVDMAGAWDEWGIGTWNVAQTYADVVIRLGKGYMKCGQAYGYTAIMR